MSGIVANNIALGLGLMVFAAHAPQGWAVVQLLLMGMAGWAFIQAGELFQINTSYFRRGSWRFPSVIALAYSGLFLITDGFVVHVLLGLTTALSFFHAGGRWCAETRCS